MTIPIDQCPGCGGDGYYLHADDWGPDVACRRCQGHGLVGNARLIERIVSGALGDPVTRAAVEREWVTMQADAATIAAD